MTWVSAWNNDNGIKTVVPWMRVRGTTFSCLGTDARRSRVSDSWVVEELLELLQKIAA
jgi:hypothetical protein